MRRDYGFEITERAAQYSDKLFVWSEWDKQLYIKYGVDESKIVVGGAFHLDRYYNRDQPPDRSDDKFATLALTLSSLWLGEMENDIKWFCQLCKNMSITPIVSCHPFDLQMGISQLVEQHGGVFWQSDTLDAVMLSDFVLTQFSTIAVESALLNKPVFYLNRSEHDEFEQQLFMEIIDKTTDQSKLVEYLKEVSGEPTNQEMLEAYKMDGKRTDFVMEKLYELSSL